MVKRVSVVYLFAVSGGSVSSAVCWRHVSDNSPDTRTHTRSVMWELVSHPCCWRAVSTPTPLGVHRPVAGAVLLAVNDRTEGVPHRWCTCLERSSLWRCVCSLAGCLWTAFEDRTFSPLLQRCL